MKTILHHKLIGPHFLQEMSSNLNLYSKNKLVNQNDSHGDIYIKKGKNQLILQKKTGFSKFSNFNSFSQVS
jgi:hypothetical protein